MWILFDKQTRKVIAYAVEGQAGLYPTAEPGQEIRLLDCTFAEFEEACKESSNGWDQDRPGPMFLHDAPEEANRSESTSGKGVKVGSMAVECEHPNNVLSGATPLHEIIENERRKKGAKLAGPVLPEELSAAEEIRDGLKRPDFAGDRRKVR